MIPAKDGLDMVGLFFLVDMNSKKAYWSAVVIQTTPSFVRQAFYKNQPGKVDISGTQFEGPGHAGNISGANTNLHETPRIFSHTWLHGE